jgi:hypothetical protein
MNMQTELVYPRAVEATIRGMPATTSGSSSTVTGPKYLDPEAFAVAQGGIPERTASAGAEVGFDLLHRQPTGRL